MESRGRRSAAQPYRSERAGLVIRRVELQPSVRACSAQLVAQRPARDWLSADRVGFLRHRPQRSFEPSTLHAFALPRPTTGPVNSRRTDAQGSAA